MSCVGDSTVTENIYKCKIKIKMQDAFSIFFQIITMATTLRNQTLMIGKTGSSVVSFQVNF